MSGLIDPRGGTATRAWMLESDLWQKSLLLGSFGLVPLLAGFLLVSRR